MYNLVKDSMAGKKKKKKEKKWKGPLKKKRIIQ